MSWESTTQGLGVLGTWFLEPRTQEFGSIGLRVLGV